MYRPASLRRSVVSSVDKPGALRQLGLAPRGRRRQIPAPPCETAHRRASASCPCASSGRSKATRAIAFAGRSSWGFGSRSRRRRTFCDRLTSSGKGRTGTPPILISFERCARPSLCCTSLRGFVSIAWQVPAQQVIDGRCLRQIYSRGEHLEFSLSHPCVASG